MDVVDVEQVTRLADSLSPSEKRRLDEDLSRKLETPTPIEAAGMEPSENAGRVWQSKFAGSRESERTQREPQAETTRPPSRVAGLNAGEVWMSDDFNAELPDEFWFGEQ